MYSIILAASISAVVAVAIYAVVTNLVIKTSIRKRREAAVKEAEAEGEMIKKERILQAKEKFIQLKSEYDRQVNERNQKIAQSEQRAKQIEQNLQNQQRELENKLRENDRLKEQMQNQLQILEHKKEEVDQMQREQNARLEQISGMSSEDAKNILIENMKAEAKTEAAAYINETVEEAKLTATKEAKRIIVASIQRVATETAIENAVTVFNIESDEVKGRIIGREGRNIRTLETLLNRGKELGQFVTDFTWYLRNLLLVKSADETEELLDVSTENLKLLKEESTMVDDETLIHYIRVLSELSGQLRYAAQKRVLVEVALVKLCKPQMEQNLESVLERLRILEEKMERGIPMMVTNAPGAGNGSAGGSGAAGDGYAAAETPQSAPAPVKAAPADLQRISASWKAIVGQTSGMFRQFLQSAVPKYNSETGDAKLFVEFADQLASIYVERPEAADEIRTIIEQMTGKTVEVQLILADQHANAALSTISVDDALTQAIHGIPVEEDDESDFDDGEE